MPKLKSFTQRNFFLKTKKAKKQPVVPAASSIIGVMLEQQNLGRYQGVDWDIEQTDVSLGRKLHNCTGFG